MKLKIKKLSDKADFPDMVFGNQCFNVRAISEKEIAPDMWEYGLGFCVKAENFQPDKCITIFQWSSPYKTGMSIATGLSCLSPDKEATVTYFHLLKDKPRFKVGDIVGVVCVYEKLDIEVED